MKTTKIGFVTGYTGAILPTLGRATNDLNEEGRPIEVQARFQGAEIDDEFWDWLKNDADVIVLNVHSANESYDLLKQVLSEVDVPVFSFEYGGEPLSKNVEPEALATFAGYFMRSGLDNIKNMLLFLAQYCGNIEIDLPEPEEVPWHGIYHPDAPYTFDSLDAYQEWYRENREWNRHTVGLFFYRSEWIDEDTAVVDAIIKAFEGRGVNVLPVFSYLGMKVNMEELGMESVDIAERYFMTHGEPTIDLLVSRQGFYLVSRTIGGWCEPTDGGVDILRQLNVPIIKAVTSYYKTRAEWMEGDEGIDPLTAVMDVMMPEVDGVIEPIVVGASEEFEEATVGGTFDKREPIPEQIEFLVDRCMKWISLKDIPEKERKVAFIFHNNPCASVEATVGVGFGLDTIESMVRILHRMREDGYDVGEIPEESKELIETIMDRKAISEFRWTPISEIVKKGGAAALLSKDTYLGWFNELPEKNRQEIIETWGDPSTDFSKDQSEDADWAKLSMGLYDDRIVIPGLTFGNVFLCIQPKRGCAGAKCDGKVCKILHDPTCPPPHQWLAVYRWIERELGADVIVHVGTHGYLEFLPGKGCGLSTECYPQISLGSIPHLYIYNINNPMEGITAKRRSYATIIDHLTPVVSPTETYGELDDLEDLLNQYSKAKVAGDKTRLKVLYELVVEKAKEANLYKEFSDQEETIDYLHGQLTLFRESLFRDGLHILGHAPEGDGLVNLLVGMIRFDAGGTPSIRRAILDAMGLDYDEIVGNPTRLNEEFVRTNGELLDNSTHLAIDIMKNVLEDMAACNTIPDERIIEICKNVIGKEDGWTDEIRCNLVDIVRFGISLVPRIQGVDLELINLLRGFNSEYIEPGPSGSITRGRFDVLPTGRNFYSVDPMKLPTRAAWQIGVELAEKLIDVYREENGEYPENIGFVEWCIDPFKADGEGVAQILYTMGAKPVWDENGLVKGVEVIPLEELNRPRIDCTVRVDGIFRDTMPNLMELMDKAAQMIAGLDEGTDVNYVKKHTQENLKSFLSELDEKTAFRRATYRVFSEKPGAYGAGANLAVLASAWKEKKDLAEVWIDWGCYAYGEGVHGEAAPEELVSMLNSVDITYEKLESDDFDTLDCCCFFGYHGGFTCAAEMISGKDVSMYFGDTRDPDHPEIRDMKDELERTVRTRLLNPAWIEGKRRHGYKGASDISSRVGRVYGWSATAGIVDDWVFDDIASAFVFDEEVKEWFEENNPWALEEMTRRLLEAVGRELWKPDEETLQKLKEAYLDVEGMMEEKLGIIEGDYQGGEITVLTKDDVEAWGSKVADIEKRWNAVVD